MSFSFVFAQVKLVNSGQVIKKGIELYDRGNYPLAINEFLKVHPSDTNYVYMQSELALACLANKSYDSAIQLCETVLKKPSPHRAQMLRIWAIALDRAGKLSESIAKFNEAIEYYPFSYSIYFNLGVTYFNAKKYGEAERSFMRALEINPFHPGANLNLAKLSVLKGRRTQAMLSLGVYLAVQENDNESLVYLESLSKNEVEDEGSILDDSANPFVKLDRLLKAKVALEKGFKNKVEVDAALVKQMELLIDQLPAKDESSFWCRLYYPFYEELKTNALVEPFIYHILSSSSIESVPKWKSKNKKQIQDFYNTANASLSLFRKKITTPQKFGYKGSISAWYADNNNVEALGEMDANE
ncbi:MAG: tetratricopeptide repeat protein, partial [Flammeovirgaceae bacterium]